MAACVYTDCSRISPSRFKVIYRKLVGDSADRFFSQALIIERAVISASSCVPRTVLSLSAIHCQRINSHAPLASLDPYSDRVANASMLHKISLGPKLLAHCDDHHRRLDCRALSFELF